VSRSTVGRWLDRAAVMARRFNETVIKDVNAYEVQADEIRSFGQGPGARSWVFNSIEVWSRLWLSTKTGSRTLGNCLALLRDSRYRCVASKACVLISTDGYRGYPRAVEQSWGRSCVHGVTNKIFRGGRIVRVHYRHLLGAEWQFEAAFERSEDSEDLNTAYIERMNLFIRRALVCLHRRTSSALQSRSRLEDLMELLRCYYNFVRPHGALRFGREVRTPAQQAGLVTRRLSLRDIFTAFRPGARVRWICDRTRRVEWGLVSWATTLGATCPTAVEQRARRRRVVRRARSARRRFAGGGMGFSQELGKLRRGEVPSLSRYWNDAPATTHKRGLGLRARVLSGFGGAAQRGDWRERPESRRLRLHRRLRARSRLPRAGLSLRRAQPSAGLSPSEAWRPVAQLSSPRASSVPPP
jgi:IS1 family transposase